MSNWFLQGIKINGYLVFWEKHPGLVPNQRRDWRKLVREMSHKSQTTNPFFAFIMGGDPCYPALLLPLPSQPLAQIQKVVSFHRAVTLGSKIAMGSNQNFCITKNTELYVSKSEYRFEKQKVVFRPRHETRFWICCTFCYFFDIKFFGDIYHFFYICVLKNLFKALKINSKYF